ncbi:MAG: hypothetical protein ACRETL_06010, partial [Gammaproteobacteria bacterium]
MSAASLIGYFLLWSAIAGVLGAVAMGLVLWGFTRSGLANAKLIIAVGSLLTRSYEKATLVGCFVHLAAGVFFAQIYTLGMISIGRPGFATNMLWGGAIGMLHGLIMSLVLVAAVADAHPLEEFQQRSFAIA